LINFWLIKTDENGDTIWTKTYTDNNVQKCNYSEQTSDSGYILVGYTGPSIQFNTDIWLIKTNRNGNIEWNKKYGGTDGENAFWVEQTSDGGYIFVGATRSFGNSNDTDIWLIKTSELGDTIWTRTFGELGEDVGFSVRQTKDGGYIICGVTESVGAGEGDGWILKTNANGDTTWTKVFGGYSADYLNCIQQTIDGGYIATGFTYSYGQGMSDVWIVKLDSNGRLVWEKTLGGMDDDGASYANKTKDGGYVIVGATNSLGPNDLWLIRMEPDSTVTVGNNNDWLSEFFLVQNYPNPFNPSTKINYQIPEISFITIKVYDVLGNLIDTLVNEEKPIGIYEIDFNAENLPSGVYFYQLKAGEFVSTKKMLLLK
jgi:hypothetical protein